MKRFGEKLRTLRQNRGLSLRQLASELGLQAHSHIERIEAGKSKPSMSLTLKIAEFFEITPNDLVLDDIELD